MTKLGRTDKAITFFMRFLPFLLIGEIFVKTFVAVSMVLTIKISKLSFFLSFSLNLSVNKVYI